MKKLNLEKIINTNKPELTFLVGKTLCGKTTLIQEITRKMIKKHIPTLLYCFEMPKTITINNIIERKSSELELNNLFEHSICEKLKCGIKHNKNPNKIILFIISRF